MLKFFVVDPGSDAFFTRDPVCINRIRDKLPASGFYLNFFILQYNKSSTDRAKEDIKSALDALNSHLLTKTFLVRQLTV
jgi:hypothetical protein